MQHQKVHPFDPQQDTGGGMEEELKTSIYIPEFEEYEETTKDLDQATHFDVNNFLSSSSIKRLQDMLDDYQSDMRTSVDSCSEFSAYDIESEVFFSKDITIFNKDLAFENINASFVIQ